jgi:ferrous iron transport protein A
MRTNFTGSRPGPCRGPLDPKAADASGSCRPLSSLGAGEEATLCQAEPDGVLRERLDDLGFVPGTALRVVRRAPLGDPLEIELRGSHLCLREAEARTVWVHPRALS